MLGGYAAPLRDVAGANQEQTMKRERADKRHHDKRILEKRKRQNKESSVTFVSPESEDRNARRRVTTGCMCSCSMCGNPRRHYGNKRFSVTMQELRHPLELENE